MGSSPDQPAPRRLAVCPECGTPGDRRDRPVWSRVLGAAGWIPPGLALLTLVCAAVLAYNSIETHKNASTAVSDFVYTSPLAATHGGLTLRDLREIADGRRGGRLLARECRRMVRRVGSYPGRESITVYARLAEGRAGIRHEWVSVGWPAPWFDWSREGMYADAFAMEGPTPHSWPTETRSIWTRYWSSSAPGGTPRSPTVARFFPSIPGFALSFLLVVLACHGADGVARLLARGRREARRRALLVSAGAMLGIIAGASLLTAEREVSIDLNPAVWSPTGGVSFTERRGSFDTRLTGARVEELLDGDAALSSGPGLATQDEGVRQIARAILVAAGSDAPHADALELGFKWPSQPAWIGHGYLGWPGQWILWSEWDAQPGSIPRPGRGFHLDWRRPYQLGFEVPGPGIVGSGQTAPTATYRQVYIALDALAVPVLAAWLLWAVGHAMLACLRWITVRRRLQSGLCVVCGYDLRLPEGDGQA